MLSEIFKSNTDKEMFLKGMINIIHADGKVDETEVYLLNVFLKELNLEFNKEEMLKLGQTDFFNIQFSNKNQEKVFLEEAIKMGCIDGDYDDNEKSVVKKIANSFNWSDLEVENLEHELLDNISNWLIQGKEIELK